MIPDGSWMMLEIIDDAAEEIVTTRNTWTTWKTK